MLLFTLKSANIQAGVSLQKQRQKVVKFYVEFKISVNFMSKYGIFAKSHKKSFLFVKFVIFNVVIIQQKANFPNKCQAKFAKKFCFHRKSYFIINTCLFKSNNGT